jgi:hypothetical protein
MKIRRLCQKETMVWSAGQILLYKLKFVVVEHFLPGVICE